MNPESQTLIALNVALLLQLAGLAFAVVADPYVSRQQRKIRNSLQMSFAVPTWYLLPQVWVVELELVLLL